MIAIDGAVRIVDCYSHLLKSYTTVGVVAIAVVPPSEVFWLTATSPSTRELEESVAYAYRTQECVFDGPPEGAGVCRKNIYVIKSGRMLKGEIAVEGYRTYRYQSYLILADGELNDIGIRKAVALNRAAHDMANRFASTYFRLQLRRLGCVTAHGIHPNPELSYF